MMLRISKDLIFDEVKHLDKGKAMEAEDEG